jgi:hypothetical protein
MERVTTIINVAILAVILTGCMGAAPIKSASGPDTSVAYGNITLPDNKVIRHVMLYKVGEVYVPPFKSPPTGHTYTNGNFFFENLKPGKYYLVGFMSGQNAFYFNYSGLSKEEFIDKVAIEIEPGAVTYLGSYKVTGIDRNFLKSDTFDIEASETPSRSTILTHLQNAAKGTEWDQRFASAMNDK